MQIRSDVYLQVWLRLTGEAIFHQMTGDPITYNVYQSEDNYEAESTAKVFLIKVEISLAERRNLQDPVKVENIIEAHLPNSPKTKVLPTKLK